MKQTTRILALLLVLVMLFATSACVKGDKGDTGAQGIQGEKGDKGDTGAQGIQGEKGDKGDTGAQGIQGEKGDKGDTGAQGIQGEKGDKGDTGAQGIQGEKGDKGDTGAQGIQGEKGDKGDDAAHANETHTISYDATGGTLPSGFASSVTVNYGDTLTLPIPTRANFTFEGWYTGTTVNDGKFTSVTPVTKTLTLYARWKADTQYRLTFDTDGGNGISPMYYDFDEAITALPTPVKYGCVFEGWFLDKGFTNHVAYPLTLTENTVLYAKWSTAYYYINFHTGNSTTIPAQYAAAGTVYNSFTAPAYTNHQFEGWYLDSGFTQKVTYPFTLECDTDLFAKWDVVYYTFSFVSNGGSYVSSKQFQGGVYVDSLPKPTRTDYRFDGWYTDGTLKNAVTYPYQATQNEILYAKWTWIDPYADYIKISNAVDFQNITDMNANYVMTADIDLGGMEIIMLGTTQKPFTGIFDGNGYTLSNFTVNVPTSEKSNAGLFAVNNGTICSLTVTGMALTVKGISNCGGLVGTNAGIIHQVTVNTNIQGNSSIDRNVGGIAGCNAGKISNSHALGSIVSQDGNSGDDLYTGGIAGLNQGNISKCLSSASVVCNASLSGSMNYIGGIAGMNDEAMIEYCLFVGATGGKQIDASNAVAGATSTENSAQNNNYKSSAVTIIGGTAVPNSYLDDHNFYTGTLEWDDTVWDLTNLDFEKGLYPKLY